MRSHFCGLVDERLIGQTVTLCGWADVARNLGGVCFIDLRDHQGIVQIVSEPGDSAHATASEIGYEDCLRVTGTVRARHSINERLASGRVEVVAEHIEVLNTARDLPFHFHENPAEELRLKYRFLDLRRPVMQAMLRTRGALVSALRRYLDARGFQDIETPILTKATPEGARFSRYLSLGGRQADMAKRFVNEKALASTERYMALAREAGMDIVTMATAWSKQHDYVASTIVGVTTEDQVAPILAAADMVLPDDLMKAIYKVSREIMYPMG